MEEVECKCGSLDIYAYGKVKNLCKKCFTKRVLQTKRYCNFCKTKETSTGKTICDNCKKLRK